MFLSFLRKRVVNPMSRCANPTPVKLSMKPIPRPPTVPQRSPPKRATWVSDWITNIRVVAKHS